MARTVERTRNGGTWTEAEYWNRISGALRKAFAGWRPGAACIKRAKTEFVSPNPDTGRMKGVYRCEHCQCTCWREDLQIDHVKPVGRMRSYDDLVEALKRLTSKTKTTFKRCAKRATTRRRKRNEKHALTVEGE